MCVELFSQHTIFLFSTAFAKNTSSVRKSSTLLFEAEQTQYGVNSFINTVGLTNALMQMPLLLNNNRYSKGTQAKTG